MITIMSVESANTPGLIETRTYSFVVPPHVASTACVPSIVNSYLSDGYARRPNVFTHFHVSISLVAPSERRPIIEKSSRADRELS